MTEGFVVRKCEILVVWPYTSGWCYNQYEYQNQKHTESCDVVLFILGVIWQYCWFYIELNI